MRDFFRFSLDTLRFALSNLGIYTLTVVLSAMLTGLFVHTNAFIRYSSFVVMMALLLFLSLLEGVIRGEGDAGYARRMEKQREARDVEITKKELGRYFYPWKGFTAPALATAPIIILAVYLLLTRDSGWLMTIERILLWPFVVLFQSDVLEDVAPISWYYLPMSLVYPAAVATGYMLGPTSLGRLLGQISKKDQERRRRKSRRV